MSTCTVEVEPGVCKMHAKITAKPSDDMMSVIVSIESPCKFVKEYAVALKPIEAYTEFNLPMVQNPVYKAAEGTIQHIACPIPCAVAKAVEVAADMGLPRPVSFDIQKND